MGHAVRRHVPIDSGGMVGNYILGKQLGAGGMGVVYEAAVPDGEAVAIKLPYYETLDDDYAARRFRDEGIAGSIVEHPHLARIHERGETAAGIPYLVMKRASGERLSTRIAREGMLSLRRAAIVARQVLDALGALHAAGIVHADVKTDNVMLHVDADGRELSTLIDFGLAHPELDSQPIATREELVSGTPDYMAPEVIRGEGSTAASDLYSAGVILYELVTGTTPFAGGSSSEIVHRHLYDHVIPPSLRRPDRDVPPILERIVLRALEKDPAQRFASAAAFASALAVALPCLADEMTGGPTGAFSTDAPTLDWHVRDNYPRPRPRRLARGSKVHRGRRR